MQGVAATTCVHPCRSTKRKQQIVMMPIKAPGYGNRFLEWIKNCFGCLLFSCKSVKWSSQNEHWCFVSQKNKEYSRGMNRVAGRCFGIAAISYSNTLVMMRSSTRLMTRTDVFMYFQRGKIPETGQDHPSVFLRKLTSCGDLGFYTFGQSSKCDVTRLTFRKEFGAIFSKND